MPYDKPLPVLDEINRPFWEYARAGELRMQKCSTCGHLRYPISHLCPECLGESWDWERMSGGGQVWSSVIFHQVYHPGFRDDVPYNVSLIQLDEGPRMFSNVVRIPPSQVRVGQRVEVVFDPVTEEIFVPRFRPVAD